MKSPYRSHRTSAAIASVAAVGLLVAACGSSAGSGSTSSAGGSSAASTDGSAPAGTTSVRLAQGTDSLLYGPIYVAEKEGFFTKNGLDVTVVPAGGGSKALTSVISGGADVVAGAMSDNIAAYKAGKPLIGFASISNQYANNLIITKAAAQSKGITASSTLAEKLSALKGLKIGITSPGSATDQTVRYLLAKAGLDPNKDGSIIALSQQSVALAGIQKDRVDALLYPSPAPDQAIADGDAISLINFAKGDVPELQNYQFITILSTKDWLSKNKAAATAFTKAIGQAEALIQSSPTQAEADMKTFFTSTDEKTFQLGFDSNLPSWAKTPAITEANLKPVLAFVAGPGKTPPTVPFTDVVDSSFAAASGS